jgi:hypothetical protein
MKSLLRAALFLGAFGSVLAQTTVQNTTYTPGQSVTMVGPDTVDAQNNVVVLAGAQVTYQAASRIHLGAGFRTAGGKFRARLSPNYSTTTPPVGYLDTIAVQPQQLTASGWAIDREDGAPVTTVDFFLDGNRFGQADLGLLRTDVGTYATTSLGYPGPADRFNGAGWSFNYDLRPLSPGTHAVSFMARDSTGATTFFGVQPLVLTASNIDADTDGDGIPDAVERAIGLDPNKPADAPAGAVKTFQYDAINRLTVAPGRTYQHDEEGNIKGTQP